MNTVHPKPARRARGRISTIVHVFFITACAFGGTVFVFKLVAFMKTIKSEEMVGFAYDPIIVYGFVALGFMFMLGWAFLAGHFRDIEAPKYEKWERFNEQERAENRARLRAEGGRP